MQARSWGGILHVINQNNISSFTCDLRYLVVFWYLVFEMGRIALDEAVLISMILESLLHGSRPQSSSSRSITNKLGSGILTVMFCFTLWALLSHERGGGINIRLLLPTLILYALATAVSHILESMPWIIHLMLYVKHLTVDAYRDVKAFITYRDAPGGPIAYLGNFSSASYLLKASLYVLQTLLGDFCLVRKYCYYYSSLRCTWYHFADLPVLSRMATQYMDSNTTDPALDILC